MTKNVNLSLTVLKIEKVQSQKCNFPYHSHIIRYNFGTIIADVQTRGINRKSNVNSHKLNE